MSSQPFGDTLRVVGIDPGSRLLGWGVVESHGSRLRHIDNGVIVPPVDADLPSRLLYLHQGVVQVITDYQPNCAAVEDVFLAKNAQSALKLGQARGVALLAAAVFRLPVFEYAPTSIKRSVVGNGRADKHQVQQMVRALLGLAETAQEDASDALAVAICHCHQLPFERALKNRVRPATNKRTR
ncbi:MAG: crossover junction endodeoxyribonuclease RuvC [Myxococcales bacterium]|nr:crossover junction endodeoxyribonuclease RuvC [Myxococcales bacterium]